MKIQTVSWNFPAKGFNPKSGASVMPVKQDYFIHFNTYWNGATEPGGSA